MTRPYRGCPISSVPIVGAVHRAALTYVIRKPNVRAARCTAPTGMSENFRTHRRGRPLCGYAGAKALPTLKGARSLFGSGSFLSMKLLESWTSTFQIPHWAGSAVPLAEVPVSQTDRFGFIVIYPKAEIKLRSQRKCIQMYHFSGTCRKRKKQAKRAANGRPFREYYRFSIR